MKQHLYPNLILDILKNVRYPATGEDIVTAGMVEDDIRIDGRKVSFSIIFPKVNDPFAKSVIRSAESTLEMALEQDIEIRGNISAKYPEHVVQKDLPKLPKVKNVIAVSSGKGGVGKSTITSNLAIALNKLGYKVGLLDADIFGPSMPKMFGCEQARPVVIEVDGKELIDPIEQYGVKMLSMGFFVDPANAIVWRGAMASNALNQLITQGNWGELDFLLIDMPPGTSDIHLTLVQQIGITAAIVVTTPQEVALADARKGINMFRDPAVNVPILGIIENMSWFTPQELPNNKYYIFGKGGGRKLADEMEVPLLIQLPLVQSVQEAADGGVPIASAENHILAIMFRQLAENVVLETQKRNEEKPPTQPVQVH